MREPGRWQRAKRTFRPLRMGSVGGRQVTCGKNIRKEDAEMAKAFNCLTQLDPDWSPVCTLNGTPKTEYSKYRKIKVLVDSGAAENVIPPDLPPDYQVVEGEGKKQNVKYITADGNELSNLGEMDVPFRTREGYKCGIKFQICDVHRPLLSLTALTARGNRVNFHENGGSIKSQDGKQTIHFTRENGVYILTLYVPPFQGPGA